MRPGKLVSDERRWMLVIPSSPRGKALDRLFVRWTGFSPITYQYAKARGYAYHKQILLLTTIGSATGMLRTSALPYYYYEDSLVVCGSKGGGPRDPFWANNIRANPMCWIRVRGKVSPAAGRVAEGEERQRVFDVVARQHPGLRGYEEMAGEHGRHVPLVMLSPAVPGFGGSPAE